jgi:hypothetical protein
MALLLEKHKYDRFLTKKAVFNHCCMAGKPWFMIFKSCQAISDPCFFDIQALLHIF